MLPRGFRLAPWLAVLLAASGLMAARAWSVGPPPAAPSPAPVLRVVLRQAISGATASFMDDAFRQAAADGTQAILIELDTPGGALEATRDIVQAILASRIPVIVYVAPRGARAASAGTMITLAAHVAAMAPATHIGAAHPVSLFGGQPDTVMEGKIVNDTAAFIESLARLRGRNAQWAVSAVRQSRSITETDALKLKVVDLIAEDDADLLRQADGRTVPLSHTQSVVLRTLGAPLIDMQMSATQRLLGWLSDPDILFLFLVGGLIGLYIEFSHPGMILPGVLGGMCLLIALVALQTLPVRYGALALILAGAAMLAAEAYLTTFGALAVAGLGSLVLGALFLFDRQRSDLEVSRPLIAVTALALAGLAVVVGRLVVRSMRMPRRSRGAGMAGQRAVVVSEIAPGREGRVQVQGELWRARAGPSGARTLPPGAAAVVRGVDGLTLIVESTVPGSGSGVQGQAQQPSRNPDP